MIDQPPLRVSRAFRSIGEVGTKRLLVVDDEEILRVALARYLRNQGYEVHTAESGLAAIELMSRINFALMLCDVRMPGMTGPEVVPRALDIDRDLAILMLTAVNDATVATEVLQYGAYDYLMKPLDLEELGRLVDRALHKREMVIEQRNVERMIREEVTARTLEVEKEKEQLRTLTIGVAETLINAMEAKDVYLRGHSQRVAELAASLAEQLGQSADVVEDVRLAGRLHDVGKIGIRESILNKPAALTAEEFAHVREHVRIGMEILAPLKLGQVLRYVEDHHEHWDGSGYPRGLRGEQISLGGRILTACDAYDALTSRRAYREPMGREQTVEYLSDHAGRLIDPEVFEALRAVVTGKQSLVFIE
ncbi:MAG: two-component response regulator [Gemmatimonadetes bacterium]|nr:two-component response regulator [Gemmatimonadota bacterium]